MKNIENMQNNEKMRAWITALRSGDYKQTFGKLRRGNPDGSYCHCAVGVLADVLDPNAWEAETDDVLEGFLAAEKSVQSLAPPKIFWHGNAYGINDYADELGLDKGVLSSVMIKNDDDKKSFEEIAAHLESQLFSPIM